MIEPYYETESGKLYHGDARQALVELPEQSVNCCVTSPPYWGLRTYLPDKVQLRKDLTPSEIVAIKKELTLLGIESTI